jgi:hypothetical protein
MAAGKSWSQQEVEATVSDYMRMFMLELSGQHYNKSAHRKALLKLLDGRNEGAIERKHQNISAVLRDLGYHWVPGYKPLSNYQHALFQAVETWIDGHPQLEHFVLSATDQPATLPLEIDFSRLRVDAPSQGNRIADTAAPYTVHPSSFVKMDYVAREARNSALGQAGELLVMEYEAYRLHSAGQKRLAERIEHVSRVQGDGLGYDVLSFEENGRERLIEVKTTSFARETPFFASNNEVRVARERAEQYYLYRVFDFRKSPRLFELHGDISHHCALEPVSYRCSFL